MANVTFVVPISGIDFVKYMAFYSTLAETSIRPACIIAASGGCMVSYMALMSDFSSRIESWRVNSGMFLFKPLWIIPRIFRMGLTGSLYRRPDIRKFVEDTFCPAKLKGVEIITGFFSQTRGKTVLSTNYPTERSLLNTDNFQLGDVAVEYNGSFGDPLRALAPLLSATIPTDLRGPPTIFHTKADFGRIIEAIEGTTNIPFLLPPIGSDCKIDYGVHSPSPLVFTRNGALLAKVVYFSPVDVEKTDDESFRGLLFLNDIKSEISRVSCNFGSFRTITDLSEVENAIDSLERFLLVIYTTKTIDISVTEFEPRQVDYYVNEIKNSIKYRLYT